MDTFVINSGSDLDRVLNSSLLNDLEEDLNEVAEVNEWLYMDEVYFPALNTKKEEVLPPGFYSVGYEQGKFFAIPENLELDEVYKLPNQITEKIVKEIGNFWDKKELYKEHKLVHKRGVMLVGEPGTGKTSMINLLCKQVIDNGGIVFHISSIQELDMMFTFVKTYFRQIQPDTPIITVIEDIDNLALQGEHLLLSFLDGENQLEHNVVLATSNRPQELNDLLLRPSRFDWVVEVEMPDADTRKVYFEKKQIPEDQLEAFVKNTEGYSMAHLKEVFIATQLLGYTLDEVIEKLDEQSDNIQVRVCKKKTDKVGY